MQTSIHFKGIFYFLQLTVTQTFPDVTKKQVTDLRWINRSSVRSAQHFHRMKQDCPRCHQDIGNEKVIIKDKYEFRQCFNNFTVVFFQIFDMLLLFALWGDVHRICQQFARMTFATFFVGQKMIFQPNHFPLFAHTTNSYLWGLRLWWKHFCKCLLIGFSIFRMDKPIKIINVLKNDSGILQSECREIIVWKGAFARNDIILP